MSENPDTTPEVRENLVAYLDGELDERTNQEIELQLAQSPSARQAVDGLTRTWEMLDALPLGKATDEFTERTLSTIKVAGTTQPAPDVSWARRAHRGAVLSVWVAAVTMSAVFGFLLTSQWIPSQSDDLLRELPLIENLHVYSEVEDLQFLRVLKESDVFDEKRQPDKP